MQRKIESIDTESCGTYDCGETKRGRERERERRISRGVITEIGLTLNGFYGFGSCIDTKRDLKSGLGSIVRNSERVEFDSS